MRRIPAPRAKDDPGNIPPPDVSPLLCVATPLCLLHFMGSWDSGRNRRGGVATPGTGGGVATPQVGFCRQAPLQVPFFRLGEKHGSLKEDCVRVALSWCGVISARRASGCFRLQNLTWGWGDCLHAKGEGACLLLYQHSGAPFWGALKKGPPHDCGTKDGGPN